MRFSELIPLTAALVNFLLTLFVTSRGLRSGTIRVYALWGIALTVWNLGTFFMFRVSSHDEALFWARFLQMGVIFLPITLAHLCYLIGHIPVSRFIFLGYVLHATLAISNFTDFYIADARSVGYAYYAVAGPGYWILVLTFSIPALALYHLAEKLKSLSPLHRRRVINMIIAIALLIVFGFHDSLPILGVDRYPVIDAQIFPFGSAMAIFYGIVVAYSVLQHHLLDIHVTLSKIAARLVRFLFLFLIGLSLLLVISVFAPRDFTPFAFFSSLSVLVVSAIAASVLFPRLFGSGDEAIERRLLGDLFEYHDQVRDFVHSMQWYTDSTLLLDALHELLVKTIKVRSYQIIVLDEKTRASSLFRSHPPTPNASPPRLHANSAAFELVRQSRLSYFTFNGNSEAHPDNSLETAAREQLRQFNPAFCFPLFSDQEPFGLFLFGEKDNWEPYTPHDLELLTQLVTNLSLHLNQIRLKNQILLAQEMDLLGMMSRGMAHDLNNLITPVWTYLQLARESARPDDHASELLPTVSRNVETIMAYIRESLFFSDAQSLQLTCGSLPQTVRQAAELLQLRTQQKGVTINCDGLPEAIIEMDAVLIQRLVSNLLANAIDASPAGSRIEIKLSELDPTESDRRWYRLLVIDHGEGISRENMKRVFIPYFTTKDRGDQQRGFGLGLAICRKIVHLHGGNLSITSELRIGTTIQVDLPSRQTQPAARPQTAPPHA